MKRQLQLITFFLLLFCAAGADALAAGRRVALVIGNSAYSYVDKLSNPANDAADVAAKLKQLGFEVILRTDADKLSIESAVSDFAEMLHGAEAGLFFYAGHGIQVNDQNYLIPTSAELKSNVALEWRLIPLGMILTTMANEGGGTNIVILDACRNNPFGGNFRTVTRAASVPVGLARVQAGNGTLISFSTAPNSVAVDGTGRNSPFAEALVRHISKPGEDLHSILMAVRQDVMKITGNRQVPWSEDNLTAKFFFVAPPDAPSQEDQLWNSVEGSRNPEELKAYISQYPKGHYVSIAKSRLASLEDQDAAKKQIEEYKKEVETRRRDIEKEVEIGFWNSVKERNDPEVLETYLKRYPQGIYSLLAQALIKQIKQQGEVQTAAREEEKRRRAQTAKESELQKLEDARKARGGKEAEAKKKVEEAQNASELRRLQEDQRAADLELKKLQGEVRAAREAAAQAEERRLGAEKAAEEARSEARVEREEAAEAARTQVEAKKAEEDARKAQEAKREGEARRAEEEAKEQAHKAEEARKQADGKKVEKTAQEQTSKVGVARKHAEAKRAAAFEAEQARRQRAKKAEGSRKQPRHADVHPKNGEQREPKEGGGAYGGGALMLPFMAFRF